MSEHDERTDDTTEESDPGFIGGGGVAAETEPEDPASEEKHLADTDHGEF